MYAHQFNNPDFSNNPFVGDPTTAHARFPDIYASPNQPTYTTNPSAYPQPNQPSYPGASYQQQPLMMASPTHPQFSQTSYPSQYPYVPHTTTDRIITPISSRQPTGINAFQPSPNGYAQQYPSNYPYGFPSSNATPSYLAEFDPYAQQRTQAQQQQQQTPLTQTGASSVGPNGVTHPRDLIRIHKSGLEAWDTYSWKQLLSACDALKDAWSVRKQQAESVVRQYGGSDPALFSVDPAFGYNSQVEGWKQVLRDANSNFDTVAASTYQLHEVFNSYRQSADPASKRRVRESCNAAVKGLPDWPGN